MPINRKNVILEELNPSCIERNKLDVVGQGKPLLKVL